MNKLFLLGILLFCSLSIFGMERQELVDKMTSSKAFLNTAILGRAPITDRMLPMLQAVMKVDDNDNFALAYLRLAYGQGAEVNYTDIETGITPLWAAAVRGDFDMVEYLLTIPNIVVNPLNAMNGLQLIEYLEQMYNGVRRLEVTAWYMRQLSGLDEFDFIQLTPQAIEEIKCLATESYRADIHRIMALLRKSLPVRAQQPLPRYNEMTPFMRFFNNLPINGLSIQ